MKATWLICVTVWVIVTELLVSNYLDLQAQREMLEEAKAARRIIEMYSQPARLPLQRQDPNL